MIEGSPIPDRVRAPRAPAVDPDDAGSWDDGTASETKVGMSVGVAAGGGDAAPNHASSIRIAADASETGASMIRTRALRASGGACTEPVVSCR